MTNSILLWFSGYGLNGQDGAVLAPADRRRMAMVGGGVLLSCLTVGGGAALASTWTTVDLPPGMRALVAGLTALFGFVFVLVYDRGIIISTDQRASSGGAVLFVPIRVLLLIALTASTVFKIAPSFLPHELSQLSRELQDSKEVWRLTSLGQRYQLGDLRARDEKAGEFVVATRQGLETVPPAIKGELSAAERCTLRVARARRASVADGMIRDEARRRFGAQAAECARQRRRAEEALRLHRSMMEEQLTEARARQTELARRRAAAEAEVQERAATARRADATDVVPGSISVLAELVRREPMAQLVVIGLALLIMFCDGAGLLLKAAMGRTQYGLAIGSERDVALAEAVAAREKGVRHATSRVEVERAFVAGLTESLQSATTRTALEQASQRLVAAIAPVAAAALVAEEVEELTRKMERVARRTPAVASIISQLLSDALEQSSRDFQKAMS